MPLNLIEGFVAATEGSACPPRFRRWAGIALVSTLMSRRIWTDTRGVPLYGNLFVMLVGAPGSGKGEAIEAARTCAKVYKEQVHLSPDIITPQAFAEHLGITFPDPNYVLETKPYGYSSYGIFAEEISSFLQEPDIPFMQALAKLWACQSTDWEKVTKTQGCNKAYDPYVTLLGGAQPGWFARVLDRAVLEMGLPGRIHYVYNRETFLSRPFQGIDRANLLQDFIPCLKPILEAEGLARFNDPARDAYLKWWDAGCPNAEGVVIDWEGPSEHYASRRAQHAAKLALVHSVATHPGRVVIELEDVKAGLRLLWDSEADLPDVMGMITGNSFRQREQEILRWVATQNMMVTEIALRSKMSEQISPTHIELVLKEMIHSGRLKVVENRLPPNRKFIVGPEFKP